MTTLNEVHSLQAEAAKGEAAERAWETHVLPFFEKKEAELFQAFKDVGTTQQEEIVLIKMQANVLAMLKDYFESEINTGILASNQLESLKEDKD